MYNLRSLCTGDDTDQNVTRLCYKAARPIRRDLVEALGPWVGGLTVAAVCVYPSRVPAAVAAAAGRYHVAAGELPYFEYIGLTFYETNH